MNHRLVLPLCSTLALLAACRDDLPSPLGAPPLAAPGPAPEGAVTLEPAAPLDHAPVVLRVHVPNPDGALDPASLLLVHGKVGPAQLGEVRRGAISEALAEKIVPTRAWRDDAGGGGSGGGSAGDLVLAPTVVLTAGDTYSLVRGDPPTVVELSVLAGDPAPLLTRIWPPATSSATDRAAVWCGDAPLPVVDEAHALAPIGPHGQIRRGVAEGDPGLRCLRFEAAPGAGAVGEGGLAPPAVGDAAKPIRLEPRPLAAIAPPRAAAPLACVASEVPFGLGCVVVSDDRLYGRGPAAPLLWSVVGMGVEHVFTTAPMEPFVLAGLETETPIELSVTGVDNRGVAARAKFITTTLPAMAHVVLSEVLANPIGPEPAQEWVEIVNDGSAPAALDGFVIADSGGTAVLPPASLAPGAFALIVNDTFVEDDGVDPRPAPGTLLLRVPKLGKGGLSNTGEALTLRDDDGVVVSRFPAGPKTKAGESLARRWPAAPDGLAAAFTAGAPSPGAANTP